VDESLDKLFEHQIDLPRVGEPLEKSALPAGGGVYAFADENGRALQTIGAQSLRRSIMLRLQPPDDEARHRRADLRAIARRIHWTPTHSVFETSLVYLNVARRLMPRDYRRHLAFGPVWFARVDPAERFPRWTAETIALDGRRIDVGPFEDRAHCTGFIELLEDLFDLCRKYDILVQAPKGQACVYFEMGKCPAPCDGSVSLEAYRDMIQRSLGFARGGHRSFLDECEARMRTAAAERRYEQAGQIKSRIDRTCKVLKHDGRLTPVPAAFRYLVVQRAAGTSRVKPFFVNRGVIGTGDAVRFKDLASAVPAWIERVQRDASTPIADPVYASECVWLVSHFLLKGDKAPGLFLPASHLDHPQVVEQRIRDRFRRSPRASENMGDGEPSVTSVDSSG
jgi:excinuclease UvrABC nuclease subunit